VSENDKSHCSGTKLVCWRQIVLHLLVFVHFFIFYIQGAFSIICQPTVFFLNFAHML